LEKIRYFDEKYNSSNLRCDYSYMSPQVSKITDEDVSNQQVGWCYQLGLLIKRNFLNTIRLPQTSYVKLIVTIITAVFTIILF
jgi:hypothetical protein